MKKVSKSLNHMLLLFCSKAGKTVWHNFMVGKSGQMYRCTCCGTERSK